MPDPTPADPRVKRVDDPVLAVASKRIVALEADINNLRKGMVQQLTLSGKLIKAVFNLDNDYFGGRFQAQQNQDNPDPFRDFTVATKAVEAVSEELQGASAFADSPILRDGIANLITALESTRGVAMEMEKAGIAAVGLPVKVEVPKARIFPENNPPGSLAEAAGSVHDLSTLMARTRDRFNAMRMLMNEAERARSEAENVVTPVNVEKIAAAVADELKAVQGDLKTTRAQLMATLDSHAQTMKTLRAELERTRREAAFESDSRKADRAEARSLAAEIARQIELAVGPGGSDDLEITLSVLREALSEDQDIASLAAATEGVVVDWVRSSSAKVTALTAEIEKLRAVKPAAPVAVAPAVVAVDPALKAKAERADKAELELKSREAELAKLNDALRTAEAKAKQAESAAKEVGDLKARLAEADKQTQAQRDELTKAKGDLVGKDAELKRLGEQLTQEGGKRSATDQNLQTQQQRVEAAAKDSEALKAQLVAANQALQTRDQDVKRAKDELTGIAAKLAEAQKAADAHKAQADAQKAQAETMKTEAQKAQVDAQAKASDAVSRDIAALRNQLLQATTALRLKEDEAKRARDAQQQEQAKHVDAAQNLTRQLNGQQERLAVTTSELQVVRAQHGEQAKQLAELTRQLTEQGTKSGQVRENEIKQLRETQARELKARDDARAQAEARLQQVEAAAKEREAARVTEVAEVRKSLAAAEARVTETTSRTEIVAAEMARLKGELGRVTAEHVKAAASLEYTAARERQLGTDRERIERERAELQARLDALRKTSDANLNQTEQTMGSLKKQVVEAKAAEDELRNQLTRLSNEATALSGRNGQLEKDLATVRAEREKVVVAAQQTGQERDQARLKLGEIERDRARLSEVGGKAETQVRAANAELERLRRVEQDATARTERLTAELAQVQQKLAAAQTGRDQVATQQNAWQEKEAQLITERDAFRTTATAAAGERDRLKSQTDRLKTDHDELARRLEEREGQLNARLTETSRQLGELKQANLRLAAEGERLQAEVARAASSAVARDGAKEALERKESTSVWTKRLADSATIADQARARVAELERRVDEQRHQLAQFEERLARQTQGEVHVRERVGEVERRETALQQASAAAKAEVEQLRGRLAGFERDLAAERAKVTDAEARTERQRVRFEALMREAREAVNSAKSRQEQTDSDDRAIIADLMKQIQELRLRTGTRA